MEFSLIVELMLDEYVWNAKLVGETGQTGTINEKVNSKSSVTGPMGFVVRLDQAGNFPQFELNRFWGGVYLPNMSVCPVRFCDKRVFKKLNSGRSRTWNSL